MNIVWTPIINPPPHSQNYFGTVTILVPIPYYLLLLTYFKDKDEKIGMLVSCLLAMPGKTLACTSSKAVILLFCTADCVEGEVRLIDSEENLYVAKRELEVCRSTINASGVIEQECREQWNDTLLEGRVEVCQRNVFSSVCDDRWDILEAKVVCRQLNYIETGK